MNILVALKFTRYWYRQ